MRLYLTAWRDSQMLPTGFTGTCEDADIAELELRVGLLYALLDSLGIDTAFGEDAGDAEGEQPAQGYEDIDPPAIKEVL